MNNPTNTVCYLRKGRKLRATGEVIWRDEDQRTAKVKPARTDWSAVLVTFDEIAAGKEKPEYTPRKKPETEDAPIKRERKPKPAPVPRWKQIVEEVRIAETYGDQFIPIQLARSLADKLEAAQTIFQKP